MAKKFMVLTMPKDEEAASFISGNENQIFDNYEDAFDAFNFSMAQEWRQEIKLPKGEPPLRAMLLNEILELWVITTADELVKA